MTADVLSDVLRAVRLTGAVYFDFELSSPWVAEAPPSREIAGDSDAGRPARHRVPPDRARHRAGDTPSASRRSVCAKGTSSCFRRAMRTCCRARRACARRPTCRSLRAADDATAAGLRARRRRPRSRADRLLLPRLRRTSIQPAAHGPAAGHSPVGDEATTPASGWLGTLLNIAVRESGTRACGRRERAGAPVGADVRRGDPPVPRDAAARRGPGGSPGCAIRSSGRRWPRCTASPADRMDGRTLARRGRRLAFGACGAVHRDGRPAADAVPDAVAHAARVPPAARRRPGGGGRRRGRLRIGGGVQPRVQEAGRQAPATWRRGRGAHQYQSFVITLRLLCFLGRLRHLLVDISYHWPFLPLSRGPWPP